MKKWYQLGLFNLFILAFLGLMLQYKIVFPLPFIQPTNLLHAHPYFAFNGWISFMLQLLILNEFTDNHKTKKTFWNRFFIVSSVVNDAMIISFATTVIISEVFLSFQGIAGMIGFYFHSLPMLVFTNTILMTGSALLVFIASLSPLRLTNYSLHINTKPSKIISWKH